jgi:hypothetical protein
MMGATAKLTRRETTLDETKSVKETFDRLAAKLQGMRATTSTARYQAKRSR